MRRSFVQNGVSDNMVRNMEKLYKRGYRVAVRIRPEGSLYWQQLFDSKGIGDNVPDKWFSGGLDTGIRSGKNMIGVSDTDLASVTDRKGNFLGDSDLQEVTSIMNSSDRATRGPVMHGSQAFIFANGPDSVHGGSKLYENDGFTPKAEYINADIVYIDRKGKPQLGKYGEFIKEYYDQDHGKPWQP